MPALAAAMAGSGGGQADGLGIRGGSGDLTFVLWCVLLDVEQMLAILGNTVLTGHGQGFLTQQPLNQSVSTGGVHINVRHRVAVGIHEGSFGIDSDGGIGVEHLVVSFHEDPGIDHRGGYAAGSQTQYHDQNQQHRKELFHISYLQNKKRTACSKSPRAQFPQGNAGLFERGSSTAFKKYGNR